MLLIIDYKIRSEVYGGGTQSLQVYQEGKESTFANLWIHETEKLLMF